MTAMTAMTLLRFNDGASFRGHSDHFVMPAAQRPRHSVIEREAC
jgi:hypothetical protein